MSTRADWALLDQLIGALWPLAEDDDVAARELALALTVSSSRPAARYCCATDAPPPRDTPFSPAAARACSSADCTHLTGKTSWFLPFNRGWNDGAGNPPNPQGLKTDSVEGDPDAARAHRRARELRAGRLLQGREDGQEAPHADLAALPAAERGET